MAAFSSRIVFLLLMSYIAASQGGRKLTGLYNPPPPLLSYHNGPLLQGNLPITITWYGNFTNAQKSIISDFLLSLTSPSPTPTTPSVSHWWKTVGKYYFHLPSTQNPSIHLSQHISDESYSLGKNLRRSDIQSLAENSSGRLALVLTDQLVTVDGFCMNSCGFHDSGRANKLAYIWVGNAAAQCPGYCAWPFHRPVYGPQTAALVAPNNDVGADGMVVNIAGLLAGAVTNPYGGGYLGAAGEEVGEVCRGVYGKGAYPGFAGEVEVEEGTGASYNAVGVYGRKYLLPALFDPFTRRCATPP